MLHRTQFLSRYSPDGMPEPLGDKMIDQNRAVERCNRAMLQQKTAVCSLLGTLHASLAAAAATTFLVIVVLVESVDLYTHLL